MENISFITGVDQRHFFTGKYIELRTAHGFADDSVIALPGDETIAGKLAGAVSLAHMPHDQGGHGHSRTIHGSTVANDFFE